MDIASPQLRRTYADLCRGYSLGSYQDRPVYIKHFTVFDYTEVDTVREQAFKDAVTRGIKTENEQLKWLGSNGLWTTTDAQSIITQTGYVESLRKTRSKMPYQSQVAQLNKQISEAEAALTKLEQKKASLLRKTAEQVADQRVQYEYMRLAFFEDDKLTQPVLTANDVAMLDGQEADSLLYSYIASVEPFSSEALRHIAIAPFFTNHYYLCGDDLSRFFGKPIYALTMYQANLLSYGHYFKTMMSQTEIPKEMMNNPDKIEEFVARSRNMKSLVDRAGEGDRVALVGATKEDFNALGVEDSSKLVRTDIAKGFKSGLEAAQTREITYTKPR